MKKYKKKDILEAISGTEDVWEFKELENEVIEDKDHDYPYLGWCVHCYEVYFLPTAKPDPYDPKIGYLCPFCGACSYIDFIKIARI